MHDAVAVEEDDIRLDVERFEGPECEATFSEGEVAAGVRAVGLALDDGLRENPEARVHRDRRCPGARTVLRVGDVDARGYAR